jgi:hypothetical protein
VRSNRKQHLARSVVTFGGGLLSLLALALPIGCGASTNVAPPAQTATSEAAGDEIARYKGKLAELRVHPAAKEAASDLEKADGWLETARGLMVDSPESPRLRSHLDAVKAQLILIQSFYLLRESERAGGGPVVSPPSDGDTDDIAPTSAHVGGKS